jgi:hypothetical protein
MTDSDPEVKSGTAGKAGMIAIATALIGAATTIAVAYINKGTPATEVKPSTPPPTQISSSEASPNSAPTPALDPQPAPQQFMPTIHQIAGIWTAQDGEQLEIAQAGSRLTMSGGTMTEAGPLLWQGFGTINDRTVKWTGQFSVNGNQFEMECSGRLTSTGKSIQGICDSMGQKGPFQYTR